MWKEQHFYGSSRLGIFAPEVKIQGVYVLDVAALKQSVRAYELTNHLGNVLSTITDKGVITSAQDYFPFGLTLASRSFTEGGSSYRFGFNGMEHDRDLKQQDYKNRINRPDLGRFLSVDPLSKSFPWYSPYQFAGNMPTIAIDLDGREPLITVTKQVTGYTKAFVYGASVVTTDYFVVPTYLTIVSYKHPDNTVTEVGKFNAVRDGWYGLGVSITPEKIKYEFFTNRSLDPAQGDIHTTVKKEYSEKYGVRDPAFVMQDIQGEESPKSWNYVYKVVNGKIEYSTEINDAAYRDPSGLVKNSMFHVGAYFQVTATETKLGGAYGCIGIVDPTQVKPTVNLADKLNNVNAATSNEEMRRFSEALNRYRALIPTINQEPLSTTNGEIISVKPETIHVTIENRSSNPEYKREQTIIIKD